MDNQRINKSLSKKLEWIIVIICLIFISFAFWLSLLFRNELFTQSLNFILDYQRNGNLFTRGIYNLFSFIAGTEITVVFMVGVLILSFRKANALTLVGFVTANVYLMANMKLAYTDNRPTWVDFDIQQLQWTCEVTYAFPSGHSWVILILHEAIVSDVIGSGPYHIFMLEPLIFVIIVPLSRLYLGAHSSDQLLTSIVYSFAITLIYKIKLQKLIFKAINYFLTGKKKIPMVIAFAVQAVILIAPIVLYEVNVQNNRIGDYLPRVNKVCDKEYTLEEYEGKQASEAGIGHVIAGGIYGLVLFFSPYLERGSERMLVIDYFLGNWSYGERKVVNFLLTILIYAVLGGFSLGIFYVLIPAVVHQFYVDYFSRVLAWTLAGILLIRVVPFLTFKWNLMIPSVENNNQIPDNLDTGGSGDKFGGGKI